jgi:hypothetical protein
MGALLSKQTHKDLGLTGPVCPFVPRSIKNKSLLITHYLCDSHTTTNDIKIAILEDKTYFQKLTTSDKQGDQYDALITVFIQTNEQNLKLDEMIEITQRKLKLQFIQDKVMLGEFYRDCPAEGIHNSSFKPFDAPVPLLAIRRLMPQDLVFITDAPEYMQIYINQFHITNKYSLVKLLESVHLQQNERFIAHANILLKQLDLLVCED